ncbi:hypothetical protein VSQ32_16670 [Lachnospiraceae bacterium KK002]
MIKADLHIEVISSILNRLSRTISLTGRAKILLASSANENGYFAFITKASKNIGI